MAGNRAALSALGAQVWAQLHSFFNQFKAFHGPWHFDALQRSANNLIIDWTFSQGCQDGVLVACVHFVSIQKGNISGGQKHGFGSKRAHSTARNIFELLRRSLHQCKDQVNRAPLLHQVVQTCFGPLTHFLGKQVVRPSSSVVS